MIKENFKNKRDNLFSILKISLLIIIVVFLSYTNFNLYKVNKEKKEEAKELNSKINQQEKEYQELKEDISATKKEEHWESKIREQGYKKPGEKQVVVLPLESKNEATTTQEKTFWEKTKETFNNLITF
ncbi:MAG: septum formation initiator family protein [Minisyncoccales bacterium]